jgi:hypothetical protein
MHARSSRRLAHTPGAWRSPNRPRHRRERPRPRRRGEPSARDMPAHPHPAQPGVVCTVHGLGPRGGSDLQRGRRGGRRRGGGGRRCEGGRRRRGERSRPREQRRRRGWRCRGERSCSGEGRWSRRRGGGPPGGGLPCRWDSLGGVSLGAGTLGGSCDRSRFGGRRARGGARRGRPLPGLGLSSSAI